MTALLNFIRSLFNKDTRRYKQLILEHLEAKHFVDVRKISPNIRLQKRYEILLNMIEKNELSGRFIPNTSYFLSIDDNLIDTWKKDLKTKGYLTLDVINKLLDLPNRVLDKFLQQLEKGYLTETHFYSEIFLKNRILDILKDKDTYDIELIAKSLKIELSLVTHILHLLLKEGKLQGIVQDETTYLSIDVFIEQLETIIKDLIGTGQELSFDDIANQLKVDKTSVEPYLLKYANEHPYDCTLYPLEQKIVFNK